MRFLLISLLAVLLVNIVQAQKEFKGEKVTLGKKKCTCSFMLEVDGDKCSGKGGCDKKCSGSGSVEIGRYSFTLKVKKGKATISKCKAEVESTPLPTTGGSGSGEEPITMPPAPGSGSGEEPITMPPAPGSGSGPSPPMGEGMQCRCKCNCPDGSGECDCDCNCPMQSTAMTCASGFTRVCPMVEDACPEDMDMICPMNAASRMGGAEAEGTGKGCQCVPDFLMSLVSPGMPPAAVRLGATAREAVKASIKVGKTQCKCSFDMAVDGLSCKKSKGRCDKKCNGAAKGVELMDGMYMLDMKVKKGKVTIAKCEVTPTALTGTGTGSGTGSGEGAGGMGGMGSRCACVGKGMGGSGPPPPTGSGSGPVPPTGGPVLPTGGPVLPTGGPVLPTGGPVLPTEGPVPPTGTGSGSGPIDPNAYYVSVDGVDSADVPGDHTNPWKTLPYAIQRVRSSRPSSPGPEDSVTIVMRGGTYYLAEPLRLIGRDKYLTIKNHGNEEVTLSGGFPLDLEWEKQGDILTGRFTGSCSDAYYGDYRLLKARSPNTEWGVNENVAKEPYHRVTDLLVETDDCMKNATRFSQKNCPAENKEGFYFTDELSADWQDLDQTEILMFHSWIAEYARVESVSVENGKNKVMFQEPLSHAAIGVWIKSGNLRFIVMNNLAVLDMPGEFVCVEDGPEAQFSFIPPDNTEAVPIMSKHTTILTMVNTQNIIVEGIKFKHSFYQGEDKYNFEHGAVVVQVSDSVNIKNCEFSHTAMIGLALKESSNINIEQNMFHDIGYHGIMGLGGNTRENITIANNYFDGCGNSRYWEANCIFHVGMKHVYIVNNEIAKADQGGIFVKSDSYGKSYWTDLGVTEPTNDDYLYHIEYNHIHNFGQGILSDFGAIKIGSRATCDFQTYEHIENNCYTYVHAYNNLMHDGRAYSVGANFLYSDVSSSRVTFENNVIFGYGSGAMYHHCGLENMSKNNIVHRTAAVAGKPGKPLYNMWGGCESNSGKFQSVSNFHNIYYLENTINMTFYQSYDAYDTETTKFYENLFYSLDPADETTAVFPGELNFDVISQLTSSVWADPKFEDPSSGKYVLADDSPAKVIGINQIRLDNFGIQADKKPFYHKN